MTTDSENNKDVEEKEKTPAIVLPKAVPLPYGVREITVNEIHAMQLGITSGIPLGILYNSWVLASVVILTELMLIAYGTSISNYVPNADKIPAKKRYPKAAKMTIKKDPWYFTSMLLFGFGIGLFFVNYSGIVLKILSQFI